jgi:hypothetical protein
MKFIVSSLHVATIVDLSESSTIEEIFSQLLQLEEYQFITRFHQQV